MAIQKFNAIEQNQSASAFPTRNNYRSTQEIKHQVQIMRDLQSLHTNDQFSRLALWLIAGTFSLIGLAFAASILKSVVAPSALPTGDNPTCSLLCTSK